MSPLRDPGWGFVRLLGWIWSGAALLLLLLSYWVYQDASGYLFLGAVCVISGLVLTSQGPGHWLRWFGTYRDSDD